MAPLLLLLQLDVTYINISVYFIDHVRNCNVLDRLVDASRLLSKFGQAITNGCLNTFFSSYILLKFRFQKITLCNMRMGKLLNCEMYTVIYALGVNIMSL